VLYEESYVDISHSSQVGTFGEVGFKCKRLAGYT